VTRRFTRAMGLQTLHFLPRVCEKQPKWKQGIVTSSRAVNCYTAIQQRIGRRQRPEKYLFALHSLTSRWGTEVIFQTKSTRTCFTD